MLRGANVAGHQQVVAGVDLGGTGTRLVACAGLDVLAETRLSTEALGAGRPGERLDRLAALIASLASDSGELVGVGIGASGPLDVATGTVDNADTLPWFSGFSLKAGLEERLGVEVRIDNDAVTAALGEYYLGAGRGCERLLVLTLGTGVGVALLDRGVPFRDGAGQHPEAGHLPVFSGEKRCYCGLEGCWEPSISRPSLEARVVAVLGDVGLEAAARLLENPGESPARSAVVEVMRAYGAAVGRGLEVLNVVYGAERIVICGSVSRFTPHFVGAALAEFHRAPGYRREVELRPSALGDNGGAVGASMLASSHGGA